jgi:hypothetical protein
MNKLVGAWELVSCEATAPDGAVSYPAGPNAIGLLVYTESGHMSATIAEADRPSFSSESKLSASDDEAVAAFHSYASYFGTYDVGASPDTIVHNTVADLFPNFSGSTKPRTVKLHNDTLTIGAAPSAGYAETFTLVWSRAKSST